MRNIILGFTVVMLCLFWFEPSILSCFLFLGGLRIFILSALKIIKKLEDEEDEKSKKKPLEVAENEDEEMEEKKNKKKNALIKAQRLKNAPHNVSPEPVRITLSGDMVSRGKSLYGSN